MRCWGNGDCLPDGGARVTIEFRNFPYVELINSGKLEDVGVALADDIASACSIDDDSVVDLIGGKATVTISAEGLVSAFVKEFASVASAGELAQRLYSPSFRAELVKSVHQVLSGSSTTAPVGVVAVSLKPEKFVPPPTSTTATSTTATSTTPTSTSATSTSATSTTITSTITTQQHKDLHSPTSALVVPNGTINQGVGIATLFALCLGVLTAAIGM